MAPTVFVQNSDNVAIESNIMNIERYELIRSRIAI